MDGALLTLYHRLSLSHKPFLSHTIAELPPQLPQPPWLAYPHNLSVFRDLLSEELAVHFSVNVQLCRSSYFVTTMNLASNPFSLAMT